MGVSPYNIAPYYLTNYIGFNLSRDNSSEGKWYRRTDGGGNAGKTIWTNVGLGFHFSSIESIGATTSIVDGFFGGDYEVISGTRTSLDRGAIRNSDVFNTTYGLDAPASFSSLLNPGATTSVGLIVGFGADGDTGSGFGRNKFRRLVASFGDGMAAPFNSDISTGSPGIYATNFSSGNYSHGGASTYYGASVLPQYEWQDP
jgi:hypothetical protein